MPTALITGASRGIGRACVVQLVSEGAKVAVVVEKGPLRGLEEREAIDAAVGLEADRRAAELRVFPGQREQLRKPVGIGFQVPGRARRA